MSSRIRARSGCASPAARSPATSGSSQIDDRDRSRSTARPSPTASAVPALPVPVPRMASTLLPPAGASADDRGGFCVPGSGKYRRVTSPIPAPTRQKRPRHGHQHHHFGTLAFPRAPRDGRSRPGPRCRSGWCQRRPAAPDRSASSRIAHVLARRIVHQDLQAREALPEQRTRARGPLPPAAAAARSPESRRRLPQALIRRSISALSR